jgi:hypothetical protein
MIDLPSQFGRARAGGPGAAAGGTGGGLRVAGGTGGGLGAELAAARQRGDLDQARAVLAGGELLIPVVGEAWAGTTAEGRALVLAFTGHGALRAVFGPGAPSRRLGFPALARDWPDPRTWLAIDPGQPTQLVLDPAEVSMLATLADRPVGELELALSSAAGTPDPVPALSALLGARLFLPVGPDPGGAHAGPPELAGFPPPVPQAPDSWSRLDHPDRPVAVFSSPTRARQGWAGRDSVPVPGETLVQVWPGGRVPLAVNPGSAATGVLIPGDLLEALAECWSIQRTRAEQVVIDAGRCAVHTPGLSATEREGLAARLIEEGLAGIGIRLEPAVSPPATPHLPH